MAEHNNVTLLKVMLMINAIFTIIYGIVMFFVPGLLVSFSGGNPVELLSLRWPGGVLIALGIGNFMVSRKPEKQGIWVLISALGTLLTGLAILYSWIMKEGSGSAVSIAMPAICNLVISILLWLGRQRAKDIL